MTVQIEMWLRDCVFIGLNRADSALKLIQWNKDYSRCRRDTRAGRHVFGVGWAIAFKLDEGHGGEEWMDRWELDFREREGEVSRNRGSKGGGGWTPLPPIPGRGDGWSRVLIPLLLDFFLVPIKPWMGGKKGGDFGR